MIICDHYDNKYGQTRQKFGGAWHKLITFIVPIPGGETIFGRIRYADGAKKWFVAASYCGWVN